MITRKKKHIIRHPGKRVKPVFNRVPPRIVKKANSNRPDDEFSPVDTAQVVAFGMDIVRQLKAEAAQEEKRKEKKALEGKIPLSRRPTTRAKGQATDHFSAADLKEFRQRLINARLEATNGVDAMKATGFNEADDHEADGGDGTAQSQRLQALGQMGSIKRVIQQIDEALHRIDDGTYGVCTVCGQLIRKPRLLNQPFVLTCMECQSEMEQNAK